MQLTVQGKQLDLGDALRTHVSDKLEDLNSKYFNHATDATVTFSPEGHGHKQIKSHIHIRIGKDIMVMADALAGDAHSAFDDAAEKVGKQMRRYKKRFRDHHERLAKTPEAEIMKARDYILAADDLAANENEDDKTDDNPLVIAEDTRNIQTMSVSEAVMRLDLGGDSALMFRNANHEGLNMVYRRDDGNIGWIDPAIDKAQTA